MSTKVGIIAEGPIDRLLLGALLKRIAQDRAGQDWPVAPDDVAEVLQIRKRGHGGVLETVRKLVKALSNHVYDHSFFIILLDRKTKAVQAKIRKLIPKDGRFILGISIEEVEAWWLADRENTLAWAGLQNSLPADCRYAQPKYQSERDDDPKKTLDELTQCSERFDRRYGHGSVDLATDFVEEYWTHQARLDDLVAQCPKGYQPFEQDVTAAFRAAVRRSGRLF
jgi:hypothetical protein